MSRLAPGRKSDIQRLLKQKQETKPYTERWNLICIKIEDLVAEGKDSKLCHLRERLLNATRAADLKEADKISEEIRLHVKRTDPYRYYRGWVKKG